MNKNICTALITVVILATGCVIKPYKTPKFEGQIDSLYRTLEMQVDTTVNTGQIQWREFFTDTILKSYITRVLTHNHEFQSARKNIEIAYAQLRSARAVIAPTVGPASLTAGSTVSQGYGAGDVVGALSGGVSWEIDLWGKLLSGKRAAQASLMASREGVQALQTALVAQTASAYYQLVTLDMERRLTLETIENRSQYLDTIRIMKHAGKVNEIAVQQAVAQLGEVQAVLPDIELSIIQTENALLLLMGRPSMNNLMRINSIDIEDTRIMADIGVPAQLLAFRPDVRAAEQQYRSAFEMYNVSRAAMYPALSLSANGNVADLFNAHFGTLNLLAGLTQPIFNGRRLRTQKEVSDLQAQQAELKFQETVLIAAKEVSDALASQIKSRQKGHAQKQQWDAYAKAYDYSFELFVNGYATYLDVLTAQTGVFTTQMSLLGTYLANVQARIELYRALGGGADVMMNQKEVIELSRIQAEATATQNQLKRATERAERKRK